MATQHISGSYTAAACTITVSDVERMVATGGPDLHGADRRGAEEHGCDFETYKDGFKIL